MQYVYNDGGRKRAGFKGNAGDCFCRAVAIATGDPYAEVYHAINKESEFEHLTKSQKLFESVFNCRKKPGSSAREGVLKDFARNFMTALGWVWVPTMKIGSGCTVHLHSEELPKGRIICSVSKHYVAVIDGVIHDTYDCSRKGKRCVYGYFCKPVSI